MVRRIPCVVALLLVTLGLPAIATPTAAQTSIVVTTTADVVDPDDGLVSLREAVLLANSTAGLDTIYLASGATYALTICGGEEDASQSGDLDATDVDPLIIEGGVEVTIEQTCDGQRIFEATTGARLLLRDLIVTGGSGFGDAGVAIGAESTSLVGIVRSVVSENHGDGGSGSPKGIITGAPNSSVGVWESQIVDNTGATGIATSGNGEIHSALISRNTNPDGDSGGVFGQLDITDSEISHNEADSYGGGQVFGDLDAVTVSNNHGRLAGGLIGGGTIADSLISENIATQLGGGLTGVWEVTRTSILDNQAMFYGGAILGASTLEDSTIAGNHAVAGGGVGFANLIVRRSTITDNWAARGSGALPVEPFGSGDWNLARLTVEDSTVAGNHANGDPELASEISLYRGPTPPLWHVELVTTRSAVADGGIPACEREGGDVVSFGYTYWADTTCAPQPMAGDVVGEGGAKLDPLSDNGGPTKTRLPGPGSPLRDRIPASDSNCDGVDQRGVVRPQGIGCEIGATEVVIEPARFAPLTPTRVLDTRVGPIPADWTVGQKLSPTQNIDVVVAGANGVPADATGVVLNVTSTEAESELAYITAWPKGQPPPTTSVLNLQPGANVANSVTIAPGVGGAVSFLTNVGATHLVVDVMGYYGPSGFVELGRGLPTRVLDTRTSLVPAGRSPGETFKGGQTLRLPLASVSVQAVVVNITAAGATSANSYITAWPSGELRPTTSNVNLQPGYNVSNLAVVKVGIDGSIDLYTNVGETHLVVDVVGQYFAGAGGEFVAMNPIRIFDSRGGPPLPSGELPPVKIAGLQGIPTNAVAVALNATATQSSTPRGYLMTWPFGFPYPYPFTSTMNYRPPYNAPHELLATVGAVQQISMYNGEATSHLVLDASGYFVDRP